MATGPVLQTPIVKQLFEKVKKGDVEDVVQMVREYGLDIANLIDEAKNFSQTPIFSACVVKGEENSLKMVEVLISLGCDPNREDDLKQIPLFYAAREGNNKVINLLISHGADVNRSDHCLFAFRLLQADVASSVVETEMREILVCSLYIWPKAVITVFKSSDHCDSLASDGSSHNELFWAFVG